MSRAQKPRWAVQDCKSLGPRGRVETVLGARAARRANRMSYFNLTLCTLTMKHCGDALTSEEKDAVTQGDCERAYYLRIKAESNKGEYNMQGGHSQG